VHASRSLPAALDPLPAAGAPARAARVAILTSNFWPEPTGTGQTVTELARFLAHEGLDVRVATSMPYFPEWRIHPDYRGRLWRRELHRRIRVLRSWHFVRPDPSTVTRIAHEVTLSALALPNMLGALRGADVAYVVSPALSFALTGMLVAKALGVRSVLVVKDVMPDAAVEMGMIANPALIGISRRMARIVYRLADEIHTLGEGMRTRIARLTRDAGKIRIVPDTIDADELAPVPWTRNAFREKFVPPGTFALLHSGNMGKKQDLDLILRTAELLRDREDIRFYVIGDGAERDRFLACRRERGLDNIEHHPLQPRWMLPHMLSGADIVLVSQRPEVVDIVVPSKLITAMAAGAMIVAACPERSETARLLDASGGGVRIPAGDEARLADAIRELANGATGTSEHRRRVRAFALRCFDRRTVYRPLARSAGA